MTISTPIANLRFLYCGRGDTILIESDGRWGLLDANLTANSGAGERLRRYIDERKISQLDFVCVSHPDLDHYRGMKKLLEDKFLTDGQPRISQFWDSGVSFSIFAALETRLRGASFMTDGLRDLYRDFVLKYDGITRRELQADTMLASGFGEFKILALSPEKTTVDQYNAQHVRTIKAATDADVRRLRSNDLSIILAFQHKQLPVNLLFGSDASIQAWDRALQLLEKIDARTSRRRFDMVKVSHHGAIGSHYERLYRDYSSSSDRKTVAILSVGGNDHLHPDPDVLESLSAHGVDAYATCRPAASTSGSRRRSSSLILPGRPAGEDFTCADVVVEIDSAGKLTVSPAECQLF